MTIVSITPEVALDEFPVFAGGLGILEGDKFYSISKKCKDYIVLTLLYKNGYVEYNKNLNLTHQEYLRDFMYKLLVPEEELSFDMGILGKVLAKPYAFRKYTSKVVFFRPISPERVVKASEQLYIEESPEDFAIKYSFLAKASLTYIFERIGVENIEYIDLQEALSSIISLLLPSELLKKTRLIIHTPGPWGHPYISTQYLKNYLNVDLGAGDIMITKVALDKVSKAFTVSAKHQELTVNLFRESREKLSHVTNGVELDRWTHPEILKFLSKGQFNVEEFRKAHERAKRDLLNLLKEYKGNIPSEETFVVSWVRRVTPYKRPYFAVRLAEEFKEFNNILFILGGKAHPKDGMGVDWMRKFKELSDKYNNVIFIHDYDIVRAKLILAGSDLLLFTPFSGWEACGTSYMKAGINGVPSLASRDGGAIEMIVSWENGWLFGKDLREFINLFTDIDRVRKIDEEDYQEMRSLFIEIYKLYTDNKEKFYEIGLNALKTFRRKADISRALEEYGYIKR
ncbi:MAG: glycogen/starch/alpha-glucan phosphorylase [Sulfolobus sp.]|nr:glycogen/starch/alpha-glucan phosphorylase [Sulfolobus sp.]